MRRAICGAAAATVFVIGVACADWFYEGMWGTQGNGDGQFYFPRSVACAPNGNVYVSDTSNNRIQYFTAQGSFLGKWGRVGSLEGRFKNPRHLDVARDGRVYVADGGNSRVQYFTANGSFLGAWGSNGSGDGQFDVPRGRPCVKAAASWPRSGYLDST